MVRSTATLYELELRYGMRQIRTTQFGMAVFSTICCTGHIIAIGLLVLAISQVFAHTNQEFFLEAASIIVGVFAILLNRPAMYFALEMLTAIEAAINQSRERQNRGWMRRLMDLMPLSLFIPPGDLLAVVLLMLRIRVNTDHLSLKQAAIFKWCEMAFCFGTIAQYAGVVVLMVLIWTSGLVNTFVVYGVAISCHVLMISGILSVVWSSTTMRRELIDVVRQTHWDQDPATLFLAGLDVAVSPTIVGSATKHSSSDADST